jgi:hypothetical protein
MKGYDVDAEPIERPRDMGGGASVSPFSASGTLRWAVRTPGVRGAFRATVANPASKALDSQKVQQIQNAVTVFSNYLVALHSAVTDGIVMKRYVLDKLCGLIFQGADDVEELTGRPSSTSVRQIANNARRFWDAMPSEAKAQHDWFSENRTEVASPE